MRFLSLILTAFILLTFTGCDETDSVKNGFSSAVDEVVEAYQNVATKITDTKNWVQEKIDQTQQAAEDVQDAADSINDAVDSIKDLTGGAEGDDTEDSPLAEEDTATEEAPTEEVTEETNE